MERGDADPELSVLASPPRSVLVESSSEWGELGIDEGYCEESTMSSDAEEEGDEGRANSGTRARVRNLVSFLFGVDEANEAVAEWGTGEARWRSETANLLGASTAVKAEKVGAGADRDVDEARATGERYARGEGGG